MATLTLTDLDKELLDGLQVLTDQEIGRVQAHLAAGLPMKIHWGWPKPDRPADEFYGTVACFGCLVGTAMTRADYQKREAELFSLSCMAFPGWAMANERWAPSTRDLHSHEPLSRLTLDRLAAILDMEWSRRHPVVNSAGQELEHNNPASPSLLKEAVGTV